MLKYGLCLCILLGKLFATQVQEIKVERTMDSIDVLLLLSESYTQAPKLTQQDSYTGIILPKLQSTSHNQSFKNFFISGVQIFNIEDNLYILGIGNPQITQASMSKSHNTLKVTFAKVPPKPSQLDSLLNTSFDTRLPTQSSQNLILALQDSQTHQNDPEQHIQFKNDLGVDTWRYIAVVIVMLSLVVGLYFIKRLVKKKQFGHFLSGMKMQSFDPTAIEIISQTNIDSKNRILTIESNSYRYLILIGATGTTLIDRYPIPQHTSTQEQIVFDDQFAKLLEQKQERLSQYLHDDDKS